MLAIDSLPPHLPRLEWTNLGILTARSDDIQRRLAFYATNKAHWDREISRVRPLPSFSQYSHQALSKVQKFYVSPEQWFKVSSAGQIAQRYLNLFPAIPL